MGNCLVTKLKAVVDNNNLPRLGEIFIEVPSDCLTGDGQNISLSNFEGLTTVIVSGDLEIWTSDGSSKIGDGKTVDTNTTYIFKIKNVGNGGIIRINNKYSMTPFAEFIYWPMKYEDLKSSMLWYKATTFEPTYFGERYLSKELGQYGPKGNLADLMNGNPYILIVIRNLDISGDIAELAKIKDSFVAIVSDNCNLYGTLESIGVCTKVDTLRMYNNNISGTIEGFVQAQRAADPTNRTSFTFGQVDFQLNNIYFNGSLIDYPISNFSWTANTITINDVTVNA